jgi:hypothetical protein
MELKGDGHVETKRTGFGEEKRPLYWLVSSRGRGYAWLLRFSMGIGGSF